MTYRMSGDREFWEEFIDTYKSLPCLWDSTSKDYSVRQLRDMATQDLVNLCKERYPKADSSFVKSKIHSLRCAFRREYKKVMKSLKSGSSDDLYVPNLWYYDRLSFIAGSDTPKEVLSNVGESSVFAEGTHNEDSDGDNEETPSTAEVWVQDMLESPLESPSSPRPGSSQSSSSKKLPRYSKTLKYGKRRHDNQNELSTTRKYRVADTLQTHPEPKSLNDFDIAGLKYARDLASIEANQRIFAEKLVSDVIFYARQGRLTEYSSFQVGFQPSECKIDFNYPEPSHTE